MSRKYIYELILLLWIVSRASQEDIRCEPPWEQVDDSCIQFFKDKPYRTWEGAREACLSRGGDLVRIKTKKWLWELKEFIRRNDLWYELFWIGLRKVNGTLLWVDNTQFRDSDYFYVDDGCIAIEIDSFALLKQQCNARFPFICEKIKETKTTTETELTTESHPESATNSSISTTKPDENDSSLTLYVIAAVSTITVVLLFGGVCAVFIYRRRRQRSDTSHGESNIAVPDAPYYANSSAVDTESGGIYLDTLDRRVNEHEYGVLDTENQCDDDHTYEIAL